MLFRMSQHYPKNDSILLQFILSELLLALKIVDVLQEYPEKKLKKLAGSAPTYNRIFPWNLEEGILPKIMIYCDQMIQSTKRENKDILTLRRSTAKVWQQATSIQELIISDTPFEKELDNTANAIRSLPHLTMPILYLFHDDENVLFFLLRHEKEWKQYAGKRFVPNLLRKLFPQGIEEAEGWMMKRYAVRGFIDLLPVIQEKMALMR
jgi:hypothetical protein